MMLIRSVLSTVVAMALCVPSWAEKKLSVAENKNAIATVNQQPVSQDVFLFMLNEQIARGAADSQQLRQVVRNDLIVQTVLSQQSVLQKLDQSPQAKMLLETVKRNALVQIWQQDWLQKNPISKQALEEEYKNVVRQLGADEFQVRHVLLKDETAARLLLEQVKAGASLAALAQDYSLDETSKNKGGLGGWVSPALMVAGLGDAIKDQTPPKLLDAPVQSQAGWHVVRIEGKRPMTAPSLEVLQPQLLRALAQKDLNRAIQERVNQSKIN